MSEATSRQQLQPMEVALAVQQFSRAVVDAFGVFAAQVAAMVEEELQQRQVILILKPADEMHTRQVELPM